MTLFKLFSRTRLALWMAVLGLALWLLARHTPALANPSILYVDADASGANDGTSWADAYTDLQSALAAAQDGDQIWVAAGVYYPTAGTDRNVAFTLKNGVAVYGGFAGNETNLDQRDWQAHPTVLSGDIDKNDVNDDGNFIAESWSHIVGNNSYNVVRGNNVDGPAVLDGFVITAGRANSNGPGNVGEGGGIYLTNNAAPTLRNLILSGSYVFRGGGGLSATANSQPALTDVTFTGNRADLDGGGMYVVDGAATLTRVTFDGNRADDGAGLYAQDSTLSATETTFRDNTGDTGGGLYTVRSTLELDAVTFDGNSGSGAYILGSTATIANSSFTNNTRGSGGGIWVTASAITLTNTSFISNTATGIASSGGGIYLFKDTTLVGTDLTFRDNTARGSGGGFCACHEGNNVTLTRVVFENNGAARGGAIHLTSESPFNRLSTATIEDFVVTGNTAESGGGGIELGAGTWTLRRGLIHANGTGGSGGGVELSGSRAFATLENVTLSGNTAEGGFGGGGIFHQGESLTLRNVTITGNTATTGEGVGLYVSGPAGPLTMVNTILAGNGSEDLLRDGPHGEAFIVRHSLVQRQRNAGLTDGVDGNIIGHDPLLGPLADNGGFSQTHALQPGSLAVDAGDNATCLSEDQRQVARPVDGDDDGTATCDMGAYEAPPGSGPRKFIYLPVVVR